jgi:acetyltransferase
MLQAHCNVPTARVGEVALVLVKLAQLAADVPTLTRFSRTRTGSSQSMRGWRSRRWRTDTTVRATRALPRGLIRRNGSAGLLFRIGRSWCFRCARTTRACIAPSSSGRRRRICDCVSSSRCDLSHRFIARLTRIDYARAIALCRYRPVQRGNARCRAAACGRRLRQGPNAILVRSDLKRLRLRLRLIQIILEYARRLGLKAIHARCCARTAPCSPLCRELGFTIAPEPNDVTQRVVKAG